MPHAGDLKASFHVGDTPYDVRAAKHAGVVPVGVTTGIFSADDLLSSVPDTVLLPSLADLRSVLAAFGLE
jgi:phosphoglycolate phosphatase